MKQIFGLLLLLFLLLLSVPVMRFYFFKEPLPFLKTPTATIKSHTFRLTVARTEEEKATGLSKHRSLASNQGMLFPFDVPGYYSFWMKNMKFSIDIIFIKNGEIVSIYSDVPPISSDEPNPPTYQPEEPADTVLEIAAGLTQKYNIQKGDTVIIENLPTK